MPSSRKVRLARNAEADLRDLLQHTLDTWGRRQRDRYRSEMMTQISRLGAFPFLGPARDELFDGCRSLRIRHHVVYYHLTDDAVVILRLLHERQDPHGAVTREDSM